ncbi:MAG: phosphatidylglycerophosphatase A [Methylococcales bacterium]|jgi:phosphatidylglycerophosphatase A|nr:phosphatidylglycerophosphatase A [Methylococcales bacterium]HIG91059.1 phosphatidylglycerophosphatase A [Methylococcaceae bacterium]MBT3507785.1 phosphatidylglycerophosphatase A [Methylococcales bacterium]MBT3698602.1 phosphatidylglycerophosphatase A [Methylococcales bacterium]MBT3816082.1 phosphatidylglycerophosphatase A [Methylococcales bacterium]
MRIGKNKLTAQQIMTDWRLFLAFGFGSGLCPKGPGTAGTLAAIPVYLLLLAFGEQVYLLATLVICVSGVWICQYAADKLGVHDFGGIVWDEIAGYLVTMLFVPFSWAAVLIGFLLFRLFDIFKPWPICILDQELGGGLGIMLDDLLAGLFSWAILMGLVWLGFLQ